MIVFKEIEQLEKEIEKLKKENLYLKNLLKENNINYYEVKDNNIKYSNEEKINIFNSYFKGRNDIFAEKNINKFDNKKRYFPVCKNRYSINCDYKKYIGCKGCPYKEYYGMTLNDLLKHFKGEKSYGIYPMLNNDECYLLVVDFDGDNYFENAINFKKTASVYGVDCAIELSQSGLGTHVWIFFDQVVKAKNARKIGDFILNKTYDNFDDVSLKSFDRFFPSQDLLEKGGYGNLIALPLDGKLISEGKTVFIDDKRKPYKNQMAFLSSVKKLSLHDVDNLLEIINRDNENDILPKNIIKNLKLTKNDFYDKVIINYNGDIRISKKILSKRALKYIKRISSVINNEFYKKQRMRQSTYNISRVLELFKETENIISIPRGCLSDLKAILEYIKVKYEINDTRERGKDIDVEFCKELRQEQEIALNNIMREENGVFVAPTGFGKTVIGSALISKYKINTLILVNNISLINQWKQSIDDFLQINNEFNKENIGIYYGAKKNLTGKIDIASIHSFDDGIESNKILSSYGMIIVDEVHHLAARTFERVVRNTNAKYIYGFTATPKRFDKNEKIIFKSIGNIIYEHQNNFNDLSRILIPKITNFRLINKEELLSYQEKCNILASDNGRNKLIIDDIKVCLNQKKNILLLSNRVEHIKYLYENIKNLCENTFIINGQMKTSAQKEILKKINNINSSGYIILSTGKYIGEGFDLPSLNTLFITMPFKWEGILSQYVGRIQRTLNDKTEVCVYDYVDLKVPLFSRMFTERFKSYKKNNYKFNKELINEDIIFFDKNNYKPKLIDDIRFASKEIILLINDFDINQLLKIINEIKDLSTIIITLKEIQNINSLNIIVEKNDAKINSIIIDNEIIWYGEINPFKEKVYDDSIIRMKDKIYTKELLAQIKNN